MRRTDTNQDLAPLGESRLKNIPGRIPARPSPSSLPFCPPESLLTREYRSRFSARRICKFPPPPPQTWICDGACPGWIPSITNSPRAISRLWTMTRYLKFGLQFSRAKLDALMRGDESNTIMDTFYVYGAHSIGMPYCSRVDNIPAMARSLAIRTQVVWERLAEIVQGNDNKLKVQTTLNVAASFTYVRLTQSAALYIQKCWGFIERENMRFVPAYGHPPPLSEELRETVVALSQSIYWANYLFLMCGGPEPRATLRLENEFRKELPVSGPVSFLSHPLS